MSDQLVGEELKSARRAAGLTQAALGKLVGVSGSAVGQWEQGRTHPSWQQAQKLERLLTAPKAAGEWGGMSATATATVVPLDVRMLHDEVVRLALAIQVLVDEAHDRLGAESEFVARLAALEAARDRRPSP